MTCHLSPLKINSKNSRKSTHAMPPFSIENNSKNSSSMSHHLMTHHISLLKSNSKNLRKSPHATLPFSIEKIILKIQGACHITSCHVTFFH
jgi:hypothetical protein